MGSSKRGSPRGGQGRLTKRASARLMQVLDAAGDLFYIVDREDRFELVSRRALEVWGKHEDEVIGRKTLEVFPEMAHGDSYRLTAEIRATGRPVRAEIVSMILGGRWIEFEGYPTADGGVAIAFRDISGRKRAEEALRQSEQWLRLAAESAELGLWEVDTRTGRFTWSDRYRDMLGVAPDATPNRATFEAAVEPADLSLIHAETRRAFAQGGSGRYQVEYRIRGKPGGRERWIMSHGRVICDAEGRPARIVGASLDISERRRAERQQQEAAELLEQRIEARTRQLAEANRRLEASEASYRALFRRAPVPMHALDTGHMIVDVNDAWLDVFGYCRDEIVGRSITDLHRDGSEPDYEDRWRRVLETGLLRDTERKYVTRSGAVLDALVSAVAERDEEGRIQRVISVVTDVTARRQAEATAQREREFAELLVDSSAQGIVAIDTAFRHTVWNAGLEAMTAMPRRQVLGRTVFEVFPHIAGTPIESAWRAALSGCTRFVQKHAFSVPETGRKGFYEGSFAPLRDADGAIVGAIAFLSDTTERYRIEEQLRQAQKMEALGQITGGVAHDFNNLLTVINGSVELLRLKLGDSGGDRQLAAIERAARRGENLTRQLLSFARRQTLHPKLLDIRHRLPKLLELIRPSLRGNIELTADMQPDTWPVEVDPGELELALLNLATNARDAMPKGGRLMLASRNRTLRRGDPDAGELAGAFVEISVGDTGSGIPQHVLPRIFEPFFTTKEVGKGTGLGLSQVYGFAKESGGGVQVESGEGAGTTIRLLLPRAPQSQDGPVEAPAGPTAAEAAGRVLLVEDNDEVAEITISLLQQIGYTVTRARDAEQALGLLKAGEPPDLLLSDIIMPGASNGLDLARILRSRLPKLPVVLTTGYSTAAKEAAAEGFVILRKPYDRGTIGRTLREVLRGESG